MRIFLQEWKWSSGALAALAVTLLASISIGTLWTTQLRIARDGVSVQATVSSRPEQKGRRSAFRAVYRFQDATGSAHDGRQNLGWRHYRRMQPGAKVTITYSAAYPAYNAVDLDDLQSEMNEYALLLLAALCALGCCAFVLGTRLMQGTEVGAYRWPAKARTR